MKHKTEDYKLSAVKYYLSNNFSLDHICSIFECKKSSLKRWIERYNEVKELKRHNRTKISYNHINNIERPLYLSRSKKSGTLHDVP